MLPRVWWVWEGHRVGVVAFANLACRGVMGTILLHQDGVLAMIALGFHLAMSTLGVVCVITGSLESGWYCTWGVCGIQVITIVVFGLTLANTYL